jgi:polysaccharide export outer membrane protein
MKRLITLTAAVACELLWGGPVLAQTDPRDTGIATNMVAAASTYRRTDQLSGFWRLAVVSKDYQLGAGDRLQVDVYGAQELSQVLQSTTISSAGMVTLPLLGEINAAGLTAEELENQIADRLKRDGLMERPEVLVSVIEYQSKPIYVIGEVDFPGQYVMSQPWTLTEAILIAGGIDWTAGRFAYLHRRLSPEATPVAPPPAATAHPETPAPGYEVIRIELQPLKEGGILQPDPVMKAGDVVVVPSAKVEMAYVIGDVYSTGAVVLPGSGTLAVSRALAAAGPTRTSKLSAGIVVRYEANGTRKELPIDFLAILEGRQPDFDIKPNDVIFVPGSNAKTLGYGLLSAIPTIVQNAVVIAIF